MSDIDAEWAEMVVRELDAPEGSAIARGLRKHLEAEPIRWRARLVALDRENDETLVAMRGEHSQRLSRHRAHSRDWHLENARYERERAEAVALKTAIVDRLGETKRLIDQAKGQIHVAADPVELVRLAARDLARRLGIDVDIRVVERPRATAP